MAFRVLRNVKNTQNIDVSVFVAAKEDNVAALALRPETHAQIVTAATNQALFHKAMEPGVKRAQIPNRLRFAPIFERVFADVVEIPLGFLGEPEAARRHLPDCSRDSDVSNE